MSISNVCGHVSGSNACGHVSGSNACGHVSGSNVCGHVSYISGDKEKIADEEVNVTRRCYFSEWDLVHYSGIDVDHELVEHTLDVCFITRLIGVLAAITNLFAKIAVFKGNGTNISYLN